MNPDNKLVPLNSPPVAIDVLANDTGSGRLSVESVTAPAHGTATINDWIYAGRYFSYSSGSSPNYRIVRLNRDGSLDTTFNTGFGMGGNSIASVNTIAIDSSGKAVVGGNFTSVNGLSQNYI